MKHKDESFGGSFGKITVRLQFDFPMALLNLEVDKAIFLKLVGSLGIGFSVVFRLLGFIDPGLSHFWIHGPG